MPFHPTEGWGQIAGFAGSGVLALGYVLIVLSAQKTMRGRIDGTLMTMVFLLFVLVAYGKERAPQIVMLPHDRVPNWLLVFAFLAPAILLDLTKDRFPMWVRGLLAGKGLLNFFFCFFYNFFFSPFPYCFIYIFFFIYFFPIRGLVHWHFFCFFF